MWCPACGTEMLLPENICPACQRHIPLDGGEFLTEPAPKAAEAPCPQQQEEEPDVPPAPEAAPIDPILLLRRYQRRWIQRCKTETQAIVNRLYRKDDSNPWQSR